MGLIKNNMGEKEEALAIFKDFVNFVTESEIPDKNLMLVRGMFALADAYTTVQKYDSASMVIAKWIKIALQENYIDLYATFLNASGANLFYLQNI